MSVQLSELVDTNGAADLLGLSRQRIGQLVNNGELVPDRVIGRHSFFLKSTVKAFKRRPRGPRPKADD